MVSQTTKDNSKLCPVRVAAYLLPLILVFGLLAIYLISPDFYLQYILEEQNREYQFVEIITVSSAFLASLGLFYSAWGLWRASSAGSLVPADMPAEMPDDRNTPEADRLGSPLAGLLAKRGPALLVLVVALASFFLAGEEIDWGRTWFPGMFPGVKGPTNIHNRKDLISANTLGAIFLIGYFFVLPGIWHKGRGRLKLPANWKPAIPDGPVIVTVATAYLLKLLVKDLGSKLADPDKATREPVFYWQYMEQINEQKEMLVAIGLLMYAVYRVLALHRLLKARRLPAASDESVSS